MAFLSHKHSMAKRRRQAETASDVNGATYSTVFIDTSLDTHLAMIVSNSDLVSDLKRNITFEHLQCFPKMGEIIVHALKVKRKGKFYNLSESMLVSSAFQAGKRSWFISIDASSLKQQNDNQNSCRSKSSNPLALVCFQQNPSGELSLQRPVSTQCTNQKLPEAEHSIPKESKDVNIEEKDSTGDDADRRSDIKVKEKYEVTNDGANAVTTNQKDEDNSRYLESMCAVKNKRKIKKQNDKIVGTSNSLVGGGREVSHDIEMGSKDVNEEDSHSRPAAKKKRKIESTESSGNPSEIGTAEKKIKSQRKNAKYEPLVQQVEEERSFNENVEIDHEDFGKEKPGELAQEVVERNNVTTPSIGTDMRDIDGINAKGNSDAPEVAAGLNGSSKRTKKRVKKVAMRNQDFRGMEQTNDAVGDIALPFVHSDIDDHNNEETKKGLSILSHTESKELSEQRVIDDSSSGAVKEDNVIESEADRLPQGNTDVENKEPVVSAKLLEAVESVVKLGGTKKEKKVKKSAQTAPNSVINGQSSDVMKKVESFLSCIQREEVSSQQKPIDRELSNMSGDETDSLPLTQVNRNKENADDVGKKSGKKLGKGQISTTPNVPSAIQNKEQEHIVESVLLNGVEKHQDAVNMDSKSKKKTKKKHKSAAKNRPDLVINEVVVDEVTALDDKLREIDTPFKTSIEPRSVKTSTANQLPGSELELDKNHGTKPEAKSDKHEQMEASNEGDEINFKHYFVPGQEKNESAPVDKLKEATRPDREIKAKKNKKKPAVLSISNSPELENKEKPKEEDYDLMPPPKKSLEVSGNTEKTRTNARSNGTGVDKYNAAVGKGSAKNTWEVEAVKKASSQVKNGSQQEKSLLATPCAIFSDDSSDSCDDEKKSVNSNTSTRTPSDNSSSSGSSVDSLRNGSSGPERKEGGKNITKSQSAGLKNITMDMIFRSSSRFKKAKLTALGDSESQSVDFVPDSQANG